jgi:hypothetical protein
MSDRLGQSLPGIQHWEGRDVHHRGAEPCQVK